MMRDCQCKDLIGGQLKETREVRSLHDYEHWLRTHASVMSKSIGNPPSQNPNFSGYILERLIGKGSYGVVFLAHARESKQKFGIKIFSKHSLPNPINASNICSERNMLACLHHPFIIHLVDSFKCSQNLYVVTDFMECGCLHDHLRLRRTFSYEEVKYIAAMLVLGVEYIHRMNVVHRDLKPKNILIDQRGWIKISDMGISYRLVEASHYICDKKTVGTVGYIAPEIIMKAPYSFAVDWYSLGVVIFELLVGVGPDTHRKLHCPWLQQFDVAFPGGVNVVSVDLISRLMVRNPSFRLGNLRTKVHGVRSHAFFHNVDFIGLLNKSIDVAYQPSTLGLDDYYFFAEAKTIERRLNMESYFNQNHLVENQSWFSEF